ncbi:MAG: hypothetical protein ABJ308_04250 [Halieaceae bacterium]
MRTLTLVFCILLALPGWSGELRATVVNDKGEAVAEAVVYARSTQGTTAAVGMQRATIDQVDKEFVPALTVVYQGAEVSFPNNDNIRHHVYSFSRGNAFEIPLYADQAAAPVTFANPGVVALGCNVHDWMSAYVFVADTPYFDVTDAAGSATLTALPAGEYEVEVWHVSLRGKPEKLRQTVAIEEGPVALNFSIKQKRVWKAWRGSSEFEEGY